MCDVPLAYQKIVVCFLTCTVMNSTFSFFVEERYFENDAVERGRGLKTEGC